MIKKVAPVFAPLKLNPNDAKVVFHPIDSLVFNEMKAKALKNLILLDLANKPKALLLAQESIINQVEKGNYEWLTINVEIGGKITIK